MLQHAYPPDAALGWVMDFPVHARCQYAPRRNFDETIVCVAPAGAGTGRWVGSALQHCFFRQCRGQAREVPSSAQATTDALSASRTSRTFRESPGTVNG